MRRFELPGGGHALFTSARDGNLSTLAGEDHRRGAARREQLRRALGLERLCASGQVHGTVVHRIGDREGLQAVALQIDADGHLTDQRRVGAMILVADCLPVALGAPGGVAMLHAGWRGLAGGILEEGVGRLRELVGEREIAAVVGPGAGPCCYEVGEEVHAALGVPPREDRRIDLRAIAHQRLAALGVGRIEDVDACTICDTGLFSHRRDAVRAGRQAGVAWLG